MKHFESISKFSDLLSKIFNADGLTAEKLNMGKEAVEAVANRKLD